MGWIKKNKFHVGWILLPVPAPRMSLVPAPCEEKPSTPKNDRPPIPPRDSPQADAKCHRLQAVLVPAMQLSPASGVEERTVKNWSKRCTKMKKSPQDASVVCLVRSSRSLRWTKVRLVYIVVFVVPLQVRNEFQAIVQGLASILPWLWSFPE